MKVSKLLEKYSGGDKAKLRIYEIYYGKRTKVKGQPVIRNYSVHAFKTIEDIPEELMKATLSSFGLKGPGIIEISCYERPYSYKNG